MQQELTKNFPKKLQAVIFWPRDKKATGPERVRKEREEERFHDTREKKETKGIYVIIIYKKFEKDKSQVQKSRS